MSSQPGLMTQAAYARHRKVNRSYVSRLASRGILVLRGKLVDVAASDAVLDDRPVDFEPQEASQETARPAAESVGGTTGASFAQARTAEMVFRARLKKLEYETRTGKLIAADEVKVKWFTIARTIRDKLLAIPAKLAPQLAALGETKDIRDLLDNRDDGDSARPARGDPISTPLKNASIRSRRRSNLLLG